MKINPSNTWRLVEQRLAIETDPRLRRNLEMVLAHMKAEAALDLDALIPLSRRTPTITPLGLRQSTHESHGQGGDPDSFTSTSPPRAPTASNSMWIG